MGKSPAYSMVLKRAFSLPQSDSDEGRISYARWELRLPAFRRPLCWGP